MKSNLRIRFIAIVIIVLVCVYGIIGVPTSKAQLIENWKKNIHLGLDLQGGSQLTLEVQLQDAFKADADDVINRMKDALRAASIDYSDLSRNDPQSIQDADSITIFIKGIPAIKAGDFRGVINDQYAGDWILSPTNQTDYRMTMKPSSAIKLKLDTLTQSMHTLENKINGLGLSEASVQARGGSGGEAEFIVQMPGVDDPARVRQILQTQALLELDEVKGGAGAHAYSTRDEIMTEYNGVLPVNTKIVKGLARPGEPAGFWLLGRTPVVTGRDLRDAQAQQGEMGRWETSFVLSQDAAKRFERFTGANVGNRLAIVLDGLVLEAPVIENKISDSGRITGAASHEDASDLALNLRAGSLPASVKPLSEVTVGPSLGSDSIKAGIAAAIAGVIAVIGVMLVYYKRSGINATLALVLNAIILIAALSYFDAVLTLPGIAGVILTIGMAVDSNVLIFERIREELRNGKAVIAAVDAGFAKAFLTIIDTHVTTVVSCAFLFIFGTGPVKGFAVTLMIGLISNLFTAVFVSRTIFDWELGMQKRNVTISI